jgi:spermidine synthase
LRAFAENARLSTDDCPVVVFIGPRLNYTPHVPPYGRLLGLLNRFDLNLDNFPEFIRPERGDSAAKFANDLKKFIRARDQYLRGLIDETEGRNDEALNKFLESAQSEHFTLAYARCLTLATQYLKENPGKARLILEQLDKAQPNRPVARQLLNRLPRN